MEKMASMTVSEEDLSCPVCCEIFKEPVILACSHSICKGCLMTFWESKGSRECPICRRKSSKPDPTCNLQLKNLCETFLQERSPREPLCSLHHSELKFFCEDDKQLVCLVCRDSKLHKNHNFSPVSKAVMTCKKVLKGKLGTLQLMLDSCEEAKIICSETAQFRKVQVQQTEKRIKEEFDKLRQFLQDEEAARITALREEEKQKSQKMKKGIKKMRKKISFLSDTIKDIEQKLGTHDIMFLLQTYKSTVERAQCTPQDPEKVSGALINVAKHLGNLKFKVWEKMQEIVHYTPVTLDPNTVHSYLSLSEDLTTVTASYDDHKFPDNPERPDQSLFVLGSEGFDSGTHVWDVEVEDSDSWILGVMAESCQRKGGEHNDVWGFHHNFKGAYEPLPPAPVNHQFLKLEQKLQRIRVQLDWERGNLLFSDPDTNTHICTITHMFTERVFPFFLLFSASLRILPVKAAVTVQQLSFKQTSDTCSTATQTRKTQKQ